MKYSIDKVKNICYVLFIKSPRFINLYKGDRVIMENLIEYTMMHCDTFIEKYCGTRNVLASGTCKLSEYILFHVKIQMHWNLNKILCFIIVEIPELLMLYITHNFVW